MTRPEFFRSYQFAAIAIAVSILVWEVSGQSSAFLLALGVLAVLVGVSAIVRVRSDDVASGLEAAVVFAAIILYHDPCVAIVSVLFGLVGFDLVRRKASLLQLCESAQVALSYWVVALLYTSAVARSAPLVAKLSGYILLVVGYLVADIGFAAIRRSLDPDGEPLDFRGTTLARGRVLLVVTPMVAAEIFSFRAYGLPGLAIAFTPALILGWAMRNQATAERQNSELSRRNRELSILTESATQILSAEGDQETLNRLMALLTRIARLKACVVVTWEPNPDVAGIVYRFGGPLSSDQDILKWVERSGFAQSAPSRAFIFQNDQRRFPLAVGDAIQIIIGIQTPEVIYGVLAYETEEPAILKTQSLNLLTLLANQTALSLQDQLLRRETREKTEQLERQAATRSTILDLANILIESPDVDDPILTRVAESIRKALGFQVVVISLYDEKKQQFTRRAHVGMDDVWEEVRRKGISSGDIENFFRPEFRMSNSFFVQHTSMRQSEHALFVKTEEPSRGDDLLKQEEWHEGDTLFVPMYSNEHLIGYLYVTEPADDKAPSIEQVENLEFFALQVVHALRSARQYEEIRRLTNIDALTPAFNHRFFQDALMKEIHRHERTHHEFALAMIDIDNFKRFNDSHGHPVGDEILKQIVETFMSNGRDIDIVSRYGGEEFAIIFPETPASGARDAANRMRELVERQNFHIPQLDRALKLTVSIGVSTFPADGTTNADLIARADEALYAAKKSGKNRVMTPSDVRDVKAGTTRA